MDKKDCDTPVIKQWKKIKSAHENEIVFYRLGDFYELFYEDAILSSRLLNIQLTKRKNKAENIPMAGVPFHSATSYIGKLLKFGHSVVLCEQVGDSSESKGLMERRVERVLTPATVIEEEFLEDRKENILASVVFDLRKKISSISLLDITNGKFQFIEVPIQDFKNEIKNINPSEIITNSKYKSVEFLKEFNNVKFLTWDLELSECYHYLLNHFELDNLHSFKIDDNINVIRSSYNALLYVQNQMNNELKHIKNIEKIEKNNFLYIDNNSKKHLDLLNEGKSNVLSILDSCSTSMGARKLNQWINKPLNNKHLILKRQNAITELIDNEELTEILKNVADIERILSRIYLKSARPKDLLSLKELLKILPSIKKSISLYESSKLVEIFENMFIMEDILNLIDKSINEDSPMFVKDGDVIKEGYDYSLDELRNINESISYKLLEIEEKEKKNNNIEKLKISYNKIIGYYIEVTNKNTNNIPTHFIRKQTLKNVERFYTEELKEIEDKVFSAQSKSLLKEKEIYNEILNIINLEYDKLKKISNAISELDVLNNLSNKVKSLNLVKPVFNEDNIVDIKNGRHIIIENNQDFFQKNSLYLSLKNNMNIITGANMGGKSTYMRQNALIIILSQIGSYVPADYCNVKIFNKLFTRIGASDNITEGLSTFMVEMTETAHILKNSDYDTFILFDEIGRGTSTYEGVSIAWSVANKIAKDLKSFCLFATHYFELTELKNDFSNVSNIFLDSKINDDGKLEFTHKVKLGHVNNSYGIEVAKLAGVPNDVILEARLKLKSLENCEINNDLNSIALDYINNIDVDSINPREALNILYKFKELKNK